jgi:hypothetical protein
LLFFFSFTIYGMQSRGSILGLGIIILIWFSIWLGIFLKYTISVFYTCFKKVCLSVICLKHLKNLQYYM